MGLLKIKKMIDLRTAKNIITIDRIIVSIFFDAIGDDGKIETFKLLNFLKNKNPLLSVTKWTL